MGANTSRIKSVVFDKWDAPMARLLLEGGSNSLARERYLANLPRGYAEPKPDADDEWRAKFIRDKYVRLRWAQPELRQARKELRQRVRAASASSSKGKRKAVGGGAPMPSLSSEQL